jgi:hypothetical protein
LSRHGLTVVLCERLVVHPELGAAGRFDRLYQEAGESFVIGDVKTSGHLEMGAHEFAVQLAVYQGASHMRRKDTDGWHEMRGSNIRDDYAIVVHVDRETGAVSLYRVDLLIGRHGANLAEQIRGWRKSGPVLLPYVPPAQTGKWVGPGNLHRGPDGVLFDGPTDPTMQMAEAERQYAQPPVNERPLTAPSPFDGPTVTGPPVDGTQRVHEGRAQVFQLGEWMDLPPTPFTALVQPELNEQTRAALAPVDAVRAQRDDAVRAELAELDGSAEGESNADALTAMAPQYDENGDEQPT